MGLGTRLITVNKLFVYYRGRGGGGGGGGQKTKWKTPSSNFEELIESITNMLLFFAGASRKKSYEVSKFITFIIYLFLQLADNIIQFVVSIGFLCVRRYGLSQLSAQ